MTDRGRLIKTLTLPQAVAMAVTVVIGSGLLILPGLAYQEAGSTAIYAWLISGLAVLPLLIVLSNLGAQMPSAGGVAGFMQATFSRRAGAAVELMLLAGFTVGGAAVAATAGQYGRALLNGGRETEVVGIVLLLLVAGGVNYVGVRLSVRVQQILAVVLVLVLAGVALAALITAPARGTGVAPVGEWTASLPTIGLVFFAFGGWEVMAFMGEEFRNPKRDFPLMVALSFSIVIGLYLLIAFTVQHTLAPEEAGSAPLAAMWQAVTGGSGGQLMAGIGLLLVLANSIGGSGAAARLVYSSAREGLLPVPISAVHQPSGTPRRAVLVLFLSFIPVLVIYLLGGVLLNDLFRIIGATLFSLYLFSVIVYVKRVQTLLARAFGLVMLALVCAMMLTFGWAALFPIGFYLLGYWWAGRSQSKHY